MSSHRPPNVDDNAEYPYVRGTLTNSQGIDLATHTWPARPSADASVEERRSFKPKGVVAIAHGLDVHVCYELLAAASPGMAHDRYEGSFAQHCCETGGCHVVGMDHQSYGHSAGVWKGYRSFFLSIEDIVRDFKQFLEGIRANPEFSGLPIFVNGCSLGGGVAVRIAADRPDLVDGMMLVAPMLSLTKIKQRWPNPILLPLVGIISKILPWFAAGAKASNPYEEVKNEFYEDALTHKGSVRARVGAEVIAFADKIENLLHKVSAPFVVLHSPEDNMTDIGGSRMLVERSPSTDKHLELVEGWHSYLHEPNAVALRGFLAEWLRARTSGGASASFVSGSSVGSAAQ